jgi:hypothetical protein
MPLLSGLQYQLDRDVGARLGSGDEQIALSLETQSQLNFRLLDLHFAADIPLCFRDGAAGSQEKGFDLVEGGIDLVGDAAADKLGFIRRSLDLYQGAVLKFDETRPHIGLLSERLPDPPESANPLQTLPLQDFQEGRHGHRWP